MRRVNSVAKVTAPKAVDISPRKRLYRRLDELRREHAAPWIVAPAGSGKTALVSSYVHASHIPTIWYRVDSDDRHAEDLFYYLCLGAQALARDHRVALNLPSFSGGSDLLRFARRFFEALFAQMPVGAILVFDDYHFAEEGTPWQAAMARAFASIPTGMNLVVLSRVAPRPFLARERVRGTVAVLETSELLFTEEEMVALGGEPGSKQRSKLTRAELAEVHTATGGWPAGVSLLLRRRQPSGTLRLAADSDVQPIFDFLTAEVFDPLPSDQQRLLLATAPMRWFTADHAEALSGVHEARETLLGLYRSGFFLERDESDVEVFRYHALFRSFLILQAEQTYSESELASMRDRAARLLEGEGRGEEAFKLRLKANNQPAARSLVLALAPQLFAQGRMAVLAEWLAALPAEVVRDEVWLEYWQSMSFLTSAPSKSRAGFERALEKFERLRDGAGAYLAWAGMMQALMNEGCKSGEIHRSMERLDVLERTCPPLSSSDIAAQVASSLVMALTLIGADAPTVDRWAGRALALAERADASGPRLMTAGVLALNYAMRGDVSRTSALIEELGRQYSGGAEDWIVPVATRAATATLAWHRGEIEETLTIARTGLDLLGDRSLPIWQTGMLVFGSAAAVELGDNQQARRFIDRLEQVANAGTLLDASAYHHCRSEAALLRGDLAGALVGAELSLDRNMAIGFSYGVGKSLLLLAYVHHERGDSEASFRALEEARGVANAYGSPVLSYWRLLLEADFALRDGNRTQAIDSLKSAFAIGNDKQLLGGLFPPPQRLGALCRFALAEGIEPEYAKLLIRRRRLTSMPRPLDLPDWPWTFRIYTLNRVEVFGTEGPISLTRARKVALLLKCIVALGCGNGSVRVGEVLAALWPDADGDTAMTSLDVTLSRLRKHLGPSGHRAIRLIGGSLSLDSSLCWTDVDAIEYLCRELTAPGYPASLKSTDALVNLADRVLSLVPLLDGPDELPPVLLASDHRMRGMASSAIAAVGSALVARDQWAAAEAIYVRTIEALGPTASLIAPLVRCMLRRSRRDEARALLDACSRGGVACDEAETLFRAPIAG
jgi:LuxR family maltose regulon positive regulatory protein